jgi:integrase/recombinase XerC
MPGFLTQYASEKLLDGQAIEVYYDPKPGAFEALAEIIESEPIDLVEMAMAGLAEQSRAGYRKDLNALARFIGPLSAHFMLLDLIKLKRGSVNAILASWVEAMSIGKKSPATIRRRVAAVLRVFKVTRKFDLTDTIPEVELPKEEAYRDTAGPGKRGWEKILGYAAASASAGNPVDVRNLAILLLLHDRALRRGEVVSTDYPDDFDPGKPALLVRGKGKSAKVWLTISGRSGLAVAAWVALRGTEPGPLFLRCDRGSKAPERLSGQSVNKMVARTARLAKVAIPVRSHGLRHEAATEALDAGWDVRDVKELTRHKKIDTVMVYDDRRKDVGGQISRDLAGETRGRKPRR